MPETIVALGAAALEAAGSVTATGAVAAAGEAAATAAVGAGVSSALAPKAPKVPGVTPMPDEQAQMEARKRSVAEQMARRGRASTIMTDAGGAGTLGG